MKELNENLELNLDRKTLSNYIHGKTVPPVDIVNKIAIACNTTMDTLVIRENKNIEKPKYSYTKAVYKLNKDYTYDPFIASKGGKRGYLTYNFRHYSDNASLEPFMLMFDCDIFKAGKGSILMVDRDKINWILRPNIDAFCLMRKIETKSKIITDQYGHKKQTTGVVETLYPTIVKRIRYNGHFDEVPIDMVTYVDFTGREVIISFKEFFEMHKEDLNGCEFLIPSVVFEEIEKGIATVKVLKTNAVWHGVTYREDKDDVVNSIQELIDNHEYPEHLWD